MDRLFPTLDQVEMQLACRQVLEPVLSASNDSSMQWSPGPMQLSSHTAVPTSDFENANGVSNGSQANELIQESDSLDSWVLNNLSDRKRRLRLVQALTRMARPFQYERSEVIQTLGDLHSENVS